MLSKSETKPHPLLEWNERKVTVHVDSRAKLGDDVTSNGLKLKKKFII